MRIVRVTVSLAGLLLAACSEPPPPVTVAEFTQNPRLLEATMVRCGQNRTEMKYEAECVNAREAVNRLERAAEQERRIQLEAQSDRKRQSLRRTQEAAAAARRL
ncbi:MAG: EexN family lipoprotein, partial [Gammaproteobacteria bacterium]|nr:EexN family lipoprotein [Gammaproteobacteria bacterium]